MCGQETVQLFKSASSIIVICIDHCERLIHYALAAQDCMCGSPGLYAAFRNLKSFRNLRQLLEYILYRNMFADCIADALSEILLMLSFNDENDLAESRSDCIINREINDLIPLVIYRIDLL